MAENTRDGAEIIRKSSGQVMECGEWKNPRRIYSTSPPEMGHGVGMECIDVIDSHTAGEPTRVVVAGGPDLGGGPLSGRVERFRRQFDRFRSAVVNEPRGSDVMVGALLVEPNEEGCAAGVIFFNNVGYLGMCGHGAIGVAAALARLGRIAPGALRLDTPVGPVGARWREDGSATISNVASYRKAKQVSVRLADGRSATGDVAWGGNWFFLIDSHGLEVDAENLEALTAYAKSAREAVNAQGFPEVDHVELFGPPAAGGQARNFVLCPGLAYDRSPCGTGTSAKLACLAADGKLAPGQEWVQEGILGTAFRGCYQFDANGNVLPEITGRAFVTAESRLLIDDSDPFAWGIRPGGAGEC